MKKKLIIYNLIVSVVVLALMFGLGLLVTNSNYTEMTEKKIKEITAVYVANYSEDASFPDDAEVRVTIIASDGTVLKDSSGQISEDNHLTRPEIQAALSGTPTVSVRKSETLNRQMMYYAEKVDYSGGYVFVRVAIPTESLNGYAVKTIVPMVAILLGVWVISAVASVLLSGLLLKPLKQVKEGLIQIQSGTYQKILPATDDDDVNEMLAGINDVGEMLQKNMLYAEDERARLNYILSNVTDGIVVVDRSLNIIIANDSIKKIFGTVSPEGKNIQILTADKAFLDSVSDCAQNRTDAIFDMQVESRYYLATVRYTDSDIIIAVLSDITQRKENENVRLEFFANASHELKTPLTAIKGFNDMITLKCGDGEIADYSARIDREVGRVINLINDMLDLSKLENSVLKEENLTTVSLKEVAEEVKEALKSLSAERKVNVTVVGGGATVFAEREHMYELIKNLAENGVRYNNEGGKVEISVVKKGGKAVLTVSDNGIGIDGAHSARIFERFYRVDKSRSRATGGTGLGLAIVKHVCGLYGAEITLKSTLGAGTVVTVCFPADKKK